jgi:hypothetical protein
MTAPISRPRLHQALVRRAGWLGPLGVAALALAACNRDAPRDSAAAPESAAAAVPARRFTTPQAAAVALVRAAEKFDRAEILEILGTEGRPLVSTQDSVADRKLALGFAEQARAGQRIELDSTGESATLLVGTTDWPLPIPLIKEDGAWLFDAEAGADEILRRRIGRNELDAIDVCHRFVEAQREYARTKHDGAIVNQYAQRVISTPGKRDGLAWQASDGSWKGPVGEGIARAIAEGHTGRSEPYHGYYFKVLKGQGPAAPLGAIDFMVDGAMIGGFALVAAPAEYMVTGVKTFIVSHDGIVYEQDLGPDTLERFRAMERYNPDSTWTPVAPAGDVT